MSASPMAVPSRAWRLSRADLSWPRSVVGLTSVTGSEAKATMPTRTFSGSWSMNDWADARAASSRVGETSVARMEPETSRVRMTVASSRGTGTIIVGRASPMSSAAMAARYRTGGRWRRHDGRFGAMFDSSARFVKRTAYLLRRRCAHR